MATPLRPAQDKRGRPRCGSFRLEVILPEAVKVELIRRERETGIYRTRVAAAVLIEALTGDLPARFNTQSGRVEGRNGITMKPPPS